ncbi:MAG: hypothetical protein DRP01_01700 [Archaeoglobales archaeon]|nr:MAG: hypothetical protein DRP01_01700 [Archaeoglobales archaeon]
MEEQNIYPIISPNNTVSDAIRTLMTSDWGKEGRTFNEILTALKINKIRVTKSTLSGVLNYLVEKGELWREKIIIGHREKYKYYPTELTIKNVREQPQNYVIYSPIDPTLISTLLLIFEKYSPSDIAYVFKLLFRPNIRKVIKTLIELKEASIEDISNKTGIPYSTAHRIIHQLIEKKLVRLVRTKPSSHKGGRRTRIYALAPFQL